MVITLEDIAWLRRAALKAGTKEIPLRAAAKLVAAHLIETHRSEDCMRITKRGEIALKRLG